MTVSRRSRKAEAGPEVKFEEALARLEEIVKELEGSEVPLETALGLFEEGVRLSKLCHAKLGEAEKKVQVLLRNETGDLEPRPFGEEGKAKDKDVEEEAADEESDTLF
jgi:exodeoxyribonuclease VII small subunit